jgi:peptidoglycan-N-acetylglucosamine deacetylase
MSTRFVSFARGLSLLTLSGTMLAFAAPGCQAEGDEHDHDDSDYADEWNATYEQDYTDSSCSGVRVPDTSGFDKRVALTFDDGPNVETTTKVLDVLAKYEIKATFLINGSRVTSESHREVLRRIVRDGHILGNHTHNHKNSTTISASEFRTQVERTDAIIREIGVEPRYFRFPFGASNCSTMGTVKDLGYVNTGWHVDTADWCFASGGGSCPASTFRHVPDQFRSDMAGLTLSQVKSKNGGIVLFHDIHANTANSLEGIITKLQSEGFSFVNVDDLSAFPKLNAGSEPVPAGAFIGTPCEADETCSYTGGYCLKGSTAQGVCSQSCEGYCPDQSGFAPTFCAELNPSLGACLPKSDAKNQSCAAIPGTTGSVLPRFIGSSSASAATANVCVPQ